MAKTLHLDLVTPDKMVLSEAVEYISAPGVEGEFGVLPDHVSLLAALSVGALTYTLGGVKKHAFISGGFADVSNNKVTVLAESAELADNIDLARAEEARKRAERRLEKHSEDINVVRAQASLQRAMTRINIYQNTH